jgi:hypothetical protein
MSKPRPRTYYDLPFSLRWRKELRRVMKNGGWHFLAAGSHPGKTCANAQFECDHPAVRSSTLGTTIPVAQCWAARERKPILRSLAESLGGPGFASLPGRETKVAAMLFKAQTRLIIVNNAQNLDWRQWQELINLDDVCEGRHHWRPAIAFSGVFDAKKLPGLSDSPAENEQIHKRVQSFKVIRGHDRDEVKGALELLFEKIAPALLRERAQNHAGHVFELLTREEVDRRRTGYVATIDLLSLVERMNELRVADPARPIREVIDAAFEDYQRHRRGLGIAAP